AAAAGLKLKVKRMPSGAGHDAQNLALVTDSGMLFIPSQGGRSHRPDETSDWRAIERGANTLLHTLLGLAGSRRRTVRFPTWLSAWPHVDCRLDATITAMRELCRP